MPKVGQINATWTAEARSEVERFTQTSRIVGVLSLAKKDDDGKCGRWLYSMYSGERIKSMRQAMEARGHHLLYTLDGMLVAISNLHHARELEDRVLEADGPGYLIARPRGGDTATP
jgi:hypothetical protein